MAKLWVLIDIEGTREAAQNMVDNLTDIVNDGERLSSNEMRYLQQSQDLLDELDNLRGPLVQVNEHILTADQRSDLGMYWNDVKEGLEGHPLPLVSRFDGRSMAGYRLLTDQDEIYDLALAGELDFDDLYEE